MDGETRRPILPWLNCIRRPYKTIDILFYIQLDIPNVNFLIINKFRR